MGRSKEWDTWAWNVTTKTDYNSSMDTSTTAPYVISNTDRIVVNDAEVVKPSHYDNSNGSLYKFCEDKSLNSYEFDLIKRIMRCRKKGSFIEDLEKTKFLIDLYIKEYGGKV